MLDAAHDRSDTHPESGGVNTLADGHRESDPQVRSAVGNHLPAAQGNHETQGRFGGGKSLAPGQTSRGARTKPAGSNTLPTAIPSPKPTMATPPADLPPGHPSSDTHNGNAGGDLPADQPYCGTQTTAVGGNPSDALLLVLADALDDLERVRIATQNRLRSLDQVKGLADSREARTMQHVADTLAELEHRATLDLQRAMRVHPLGPWVKRTIGVGEKQAARLLAAIGDPASREKPSQLWQFCGHGAPSKRRRGEKAFWNPTAKMRVHLIAESCVKCTGTEADAAEDEANPKVQSRRPSPYRAVYDSARMDWAARDTSDGHAHNHALRMVGKAILLDLWREARAV